MTTSVCKNIIATGNIPSSDITVNVNSNGTVDTVINSMFKDNIFNNANTKYISTIYDPVNNKVVIAYTDNGNNGYGTAIVGTISDNTILFGIPVVFNNAGTYYISAVYDPVNGKIVIAYRNSSNNGSGIAIVGTIHDNSILFGSPVMFNKAITDYISTIYDPINNKVVIAYRNVDNNNNNGSGIAIVGTVSGTSISFGAPVVFNNNSTYYISAVYDLVNGKIVIAYCNYNNNNNNDDDYFGIAIVGTISGNSILFGIPVVFNSNDAWSISTVYDTANNKIVIAYRNNGNNGYGTAIVGTVFGDSISFESPVVFNNASTSYISTVYNSVNNKVVIAYYSDNNNDDFSGTVITGTISGDNISFEPPIVFNNSDTYFVSTAYIPTNNKVIIAYHNGGNNGFGTVTIYTPNTTISNKVSI